MVIVCGLMTALTAGAVEPWICPGRDALAERVAALEAKGLGARSRAVLSIVDSFSQWIAEDEAAALTRTTIEKNEVELMVRREAARAKAILDGKIEDFIVPKYVSGPLEISHAQTIGSRRWPDGRVDRGPIVLTGFGHFEMARKDLEKFPSMGFNMLAMELIMRNHIRPDGSIDLGPLEEFRDVAVRCEKANVALDLLLSPHYSPMWIKDKWPEVLDCKGGFYDYCVHDKRMTDMIERYFRAVVPEARKYSALVSLGISNEPQQIDQTKCAHMRRVFGEKIPKLNDFSDPTNTLAFIRANRKAFAAFHRWMADIVHEEAPRVPISAKLVTDEIFNPNSGCCWGLDIEAFAEFCDLSGCDPMNFYSDHSRAIQPWANRWIGHQIGYDYQRSMVDKPIFNSEYHNLGDRDVAYIPPEHIYSSMWQSVIHGQTRTTVWAWARSPNNPKSYSWGLILERPLCLEALSRCAQDTMRLAEELAPIQNLPPEILIHDSLSSAILSTNRYSALFAIYPAAVMQGRRVGFATERALAEYGRTGKRGRPLDTARALILPAVTDMPEEVRAGVERMKASGIEVVETAAADDSRKAYDKLAKLRCARPLAFGVEYYAGVKDGVRYVTLCNHLQKAVPVRLEGAGVDLISGKTCGRDVILPPMMPMFVSISR